MDFKQKRSEKENGLFDDVAPSWFDDNEWHHASKDYADLRSKAFQSAIGQKKFVNPNDGKVTRTAWVKWFGKVYLFISKILRQMTSRSVVKTSIARFKAMGATKKIVFMAGSVGVVGVLIFTLLSVLGQANDFPKEVAGATSQTGAGTGQPNHDSAFQIVKPQGKELSKEQIFYDPSRNFTKFNDELNGIPVIVSQQPMPEIYKSSPGDGVAKIAKDFGANELITFDEMQMYYGKDEKGPQTVIFTKKDLLVFVSTTREVDKEALKVYVGNFN